MVAHKQKHKFTLNSDAKNRAEVILRRTREAYTEGGSGEEQFEQTEERLLALIHRMEKIIYLEEAKEAYNKGVPLTHLQVSLLMDYMRGLSL